MLLFDVNECCILLVDDVLVSGCIICVVINEVFDYGCLVVVELVVLVDCGEC